MPQLISATQARNQFAEIVDRVIYKGEEFLVQKQGKPAVLITRANVNPAKPSNKFTTADFLSELASSNFAGPSDLSKNHDKYAWD